MNKIKMLALDLDGTLTNSRKEITPYTKRALFAAMEQGVQIVLASGRPPAGIRPVAQELELFERGGYMLAYNGGELLDCRTGKALYRHAFPAEMIEPVCRFTDDMGVTVLSYDAEGVVTEHPDDAWVLREAEINHIPIHGVESLPKQLSYPICKLLLTLDPAKMPRVEREARKRFTGKIDTVLSAPFFLECMPLGVAKDGGLAALAEQNGIRREEIMACGDAMNDLSMLQYAGIGVAMDNGDPAVKAKADYVTEDNDHDGVAKAVKKFILQQ